MDITDVEGDKEAGVQTLPVLLGREAALRLSVALVTAGIGFAGEGIISGAWPPRGQLIEENAKCVKDYFIPFALSKAICRTRWEGTFKKLIAFTGIG